MDPLQVGPYLTALETLFRSQKTVGNPMGLNPLALRELRNQKAQATPPPFNFDSSGTE